MPAETQQSWVKVGLQHEQPHLSETELSLFLYDVMPLGFTLLNLQSQPVTKRRGCGGIAIGTVGLRFDYRTGQIKHSVGSVSPPSHVSSQLCRPDANCGEGTRHSLPTFF